MINLPELGIGVGILVNILIAGTGWGRISQKLTDLVEHVNKQNGRIQKIEDAEIG